jgi:hypothetical protein
MHDGLAAQSLCLYSTETIQMSDYIHVEEGAVFRFLADGVLQILDASGISEDVDLRSLLSSDEFRQLLSDKNLDAKATAALDTISRSEANESEGQLSAVIRNVHLPLNKMVEHAAKSAFFLALAMSVEPTGVSTMQAGVHGLELLENFSHRIHRLTPTELMIYDAAAYIDGIHKVFTRIDPNLPRGTKEDIIDVITKKRAFEFPNDFEDALETAVEKGAISIQDIKNGPRLYHAVI